MNWININVSTLRSPEFIAAEPTERATWLCLLAYCVDQENGGRLVGAASWKDRQWQHSCAVTLYEVSEARQLLTIEDGDVIVKFYPVDKQEEVQSKREAARRGGLARAAKLYANTSPPASAHATSRGSFASTTSSTATPAGISHASAEGKEKERKVITAASQHPVEASPTASGQQAGGQGSGVLDAMEFAGMTRDQVMATLERNFPDRDVWGEYTRLKKLATAEGSKVTYTRLLAWLKKASPIADLGRKNPARQPARLPDAADWSRFQAEEYPDATDPGPARDAPDSLLAEFWHWLEHQAA